MPKPTQLGTLAGMTGLIGVLPLVVTGWLALSFDNIPALALAGLHVLLMGLGTWAFVEWFGS